MPLHHPRGLSERLLLMGPAGSGKTNAWLQIARLSQQSGSDARFYVIDSDMAVDRMLATDFDDLHNVEVEPVAEFPDYLAAFEKFESVARKQDWIIIDLLSPAWDAAQEWYVDEVFGTDSAEFFMAARKAQKKGSALDGFKDWTVINKAYRKLNNKMLRARCNVVAVTAIAAVSVDNDSKEVRGIFGPFGVKPKAQKDTPHLFHTILLMSLPRPGEWQVTTIKDRGRSLLEAAPTGNFATTYLVGVAGWTPAGEPAPAPAPAPPPAAS